MSRESGQHFTCTIQISLDLTEPEALADFLRRGSASASGSMDFIGEFEFNRTGRKVWKPISQSLCLEVKTRVNTIFMNRLKRCRSGDFTECQHFPGIFFNLQDLRQTLKCLDVLRLA